MPSLKYSALGSPPALTKGKTATESSVSPRPRNPKNQPEPAKITSTARAIPNAPLPRHQDREETAAVCAVDAETVDGEMTLWTAAADGDAVSVDAVLALTALLPEVHQSIRSSKAGPFFYRPRIMQRSEIFLTSAREKCCRLSANNSVRNRNRSTEGQELRILRELFDPGSRRYTEVFWWTIGQHVR
jgi:hypothetical protein